jgi:single-stranded DNA-binding protein
MSNAITITGNLGADPERRVEGAGPVEVRVADSTGYGERKRTTWWKCAVWGKTGEYALANLKKGDMVVVYGEAHLDEWEGRDGSKRSTLVLNCNRLDGPFQRRKLGDRDDSPQRRDAPTSRPAPKKYEDDIPF